MATLARDSSSDSDSDSSSDSDVSYDSFDEYPHKAANMEMKVVPYDSGDERRQAEQNRKIKARAAEAAEAYHGRHAPMDTSSDDDAVTENDADTEIDDDEKMAVVSLKY